MFKQDLPLQKATELFPGLSWPPRVQIIVPDTHGDGVPDAVMEQNFWSMLQDRSGQLNRFVSACRQGYSLGVARHERRIMSGPDMHVEYVNNFGAEIIRVFVSPHYTGGEQKTTYPWLIICFSIQNIVEGEAGASPIVTLRDLNDPHKLWTIYLGVPANDVKRIGLSEDANPTMDIKNKITTAMEVGLLGWGYTPHITDTTTPGGSYMLVDTSGIILSETASWMDAGLIAQNLSQGLAWYNGVDPNNYEKNLVTNLEMLTNVMAGSFNSDGSFNMEYATTHPVRVEAYNYENSLLTPEAAAIYAAMCEISYVPYPAQTTRTTTGYLVFNTGELIKRLGTKFTLDVDPGGNYMTLAAELAKYQRRDYTSGEYGSPLVFGVDDPDYLAGDNDGGSLGTTHIQIYVDVFAPEVTITGEVGPQ